MRKKLLVVVFACLALAVVAATLVAGGSNQAAADHLPSVTGGGHLIDTHGNEWTIGGTVSQLPGGDAVGHFSGVLHLPNPPQRVVCNWDTFSDVSVTVFPTFNSVFFNASGVCMGEGDFGTFTAPACNRFSINDYGEPGAGVDSIDLNFIPPCTTGVTIGGDVIDSGNFQVRP